MTEACTELSQRVAEAGDSDFTKSAIPARQLGVQAFQWTQIPALHHPLAAAQRPYSPCLRHTLSCCSAVGLSVSVPRREFQHPGQSLHPRSNNLVVSSKSRLLYHNNYTWRVLICLSGMNVPYSAPCQCVNIPNKVFTLQSPGYFTCTSCHQGLLRYAAETEGCCRALGSSRYSGRSGMRSERSGAERQCGSSARCKQWARPLRPTRSDG